VAGYEFVLAEPADQVGVPPAVTPENASAWATPGSERIARWYMDALIRQQAPTGVVIPDWFTSAISGLSTPPTEQNLRLAWMHDRIDQRIPLETFLEMKRPEASVPKAAGKTAAGKPAVRAGARPAAAAGPTQRLYDAQALSFARFLAAAESERFIGRVLERQLQGEPRSSAFNIAKALLARPDALEKDWLTWVKTGTTPPLPKAPPPPDSP
jgi:hypothetical protein